MLVVDRLRLTVGQLDILKQVSFQMSPGELQVVIGRNGSGKSSLLRCISGWQIPSSGMVAVQNSPVQKLSSLERASQIAFLPQRSRLSESIPVIDIVASARYRFSETPARSRQAATTLLQEHNVGHLLHRDWHTLSGGEAQRVALACMQAQDAKIWLLDEPANHLDPAIQGDMYKLLIEEWQRGRTILAVTHNINLILGAVPLELYDQVSILGLEAGQILFTCSLADPELSSLVGSLYQISVQKVSVFDREYLIFGAPR